MVFQKVKPPYLEEANPQARAKVYMSPSSYPLREMR